MEVNLSHIRNQANQLNAQAVNLRNVRALLLQYQDNLSAHWRGVDYRPVNNIINAHIEKLTAIASDIESISSSVITEGEKVVQEEMERLRQIEAEKQKQAESEKLESAKGEKNGRN